MRFDPVRQLLVTCAIIFVSLTARLFGAEENLEALEERAFKQAVALADPSVVRIETVGGLEKLNDVLLGNGPTSGVVVSADGYIISSSFNFISKPASILVTLPDGRRLAARQVANDKLRLLTLLKVEADGLIPAKPVPRNEIVVGQWALALGRTLDNSTASVSVGVVSALNRIWGKAIQTDAKTSPVNYGGALVDIEGRTLGIIVPMSPMGTGDMAGVEWYDAGIGFAIPLEDVYSSLDRLKEKIDLVPGLMGITFAGGQALNVPAIVDRVRFNSPAQQAGLKTNDRIVEVDGQKIVRVAQFKQIMGRKYAGEQVKLIITRDGQTLPLEISLVGQLVPYEIPFLGILPKRNSNAENRGAEVRFVFAGSPAEEAGIARGDRIVKCNGLEISDAKSLSDTISRARPGDSVSLTFTRNGNENNVDIKLSTLPEKVVNDLPAEPIAPSKNAGPSANDARDAAVNPEAAKESKSDLKTGRFTETLAGHEHDFWAYVPENYSESHTYGLVVWVHPPGDTMEAIIYKQWKTICDRRGIILISPKAEKPNEWQAGEAEFIKSLIQHFQERYSIDNSRIVVHSQGGGALMAWFLASTKRELIRGVVTCGAPFSGRPLENEPDLRQQYFLSCGETDKVLPDVKTSVSALRKLKMPVTFSEIKGLGAKYPPNKAVEEFGRWVDSLDRI